MHSIQWFKHFLQKRNLKEPNGQQLYKYEIDCNEYNNLCALLSKIKVNSKFPSPTTSACYCLAISEIYKREFNGGEWNWAFFDKKLNQSFATEQERYNILDHGFKYLKRSWKLDSGKKRRYLGTLFFEGGLPIKLLAADENNNFRNIIKYGLKQYYINKELNYPLQIKKYLYEKQMSLSTIFRNDSTLELLAETLKALIDLTEKYNLENQDDIIKYLDEYDREWRNYFPFTITDDQVVSMISQLFIDASSEKKNDRFDRLKCIHFIKDNNYYNVYAEIIIPKEINVPISNYRGNSIIQWQIFEGKKPINYTGGTVFSTYNNEKKQLEIKLYERKPIEIIRIHQEHTLSIRFFINGELIHIQWIPESALAIENPLIFKEINGQRWELFSTHNEVIINFPYIICLPQGYIPSHLDSNTRKDNMNRLWLESTQSLAVKNNENQNIIITLKQENVITPFLEGEFIEQDYVKNLSHPIYNGWPKPNIEYTHILINGKKFKNNDESLPYGFFHASYYLHDKCILHKNIFVLPKNIKINISSAHGNHPAQIEIQTNYHLKINIHTNKEYINISQKDTYIFLLKSLRKKTEYIILSIGSHENYYIDIPLYIPYDGAFLYHEDKLSENTLLKLNELIGKYIIISHTNKNTYLDFHFSLFYNDSERIDLYQKHYLSDIGTQIELYKLESTFKQLLSCCKDQDEKIYFYIYNNSQLWLKLEISHYDYLLVWNNQKMSNGRLIDTNEEKNFFFIKNNLSYTIPYCEAHICILQLDSLNLNETALNISDSGKFDLSLDSYKAGVWFIYPHKNSTIHFRPSILNKTLFNNMETTPSLLDAIRMYHPANNPHAFHNILCEMAMSASHEGWEYIEKLKDILSHIPLSSLAIWSTLAKPDYYQTLTLAILRLNLNNTFCERMRYELSIVWEWIPIKTWIHSIEVYANHLNYIINLYNINNNHNSVDYRIEVLKNIPEHVLASDIKKHLFVKQKSKSPSLEFLFKHHDYNMFYNNIRINNKLPIILNESLQQWINGLSGNIALLFKKLSKVDYDRSVVWLPIFTAYVRLDLAKPLDIFPYDTISNEQFLHCFYEVYYTNPEWFNWICNSVTSYLLENIDE